MQRLKTIAVQDNFCFYYNKKISFYFSLENRINSNKPLPNPPLFQRGGQGGVASRLLTFYFDFLM